MGIVTGRPRKYGALVRSGRHCVQYRNYGKVKVNSEVKKRLEGPKFNIDFGGEGVGVDRGMG